MKQLILDTRHIIPTGNKNRPVVVRPTLAGRTLNLAFAAFMLFEGIAQLCDTQPDRNLRYYARLGILAFCVAVFVRNAIRGERPENSLRADGYTCLQQYALHIWMERLQNVFFCLAYLCFCIFSSSGWMYAGFVFLSAFFLVKWYFARQIRQAARLAPDLRLAPRVELTIGLTPLVRRLELAALASMAAAIGVAVWVGLEDFAAAHGRGLWIWSICLAGCSAGITFALRRMLRQSISVADQSEADELRRDRWLVPLMAAVLNILGGLLLGMCHLFL